MTELVDKDIKIGIWSISYSLIFKKIEESMSMKRTDMEDIEKVTTPSLRDEKILSEVKKHRGLDNAEEN